MPVRFLSIFVTVSLCIVGILGALGVSLIPPFQPCGKVLFQQAMEVVAHDKDHTYLVAALPMNSAQRALRSEPFASPVPSSFISPFIHYVYRMDHSGNYTSLESTQQNIAYQDPASSEVHTLELISFPTLQRRMLWPAPGTTSPALHYSPSRPWQALFESGGLIYLLDTRSSQIVPLGDQNIRTAALAEPREGKLEWQVSPSWSPDGDRVAFLSNRSGSGTQRDLWTFDFGSGQEQRISSLPVLQPHSVHWMEPDILLVDAENVRDTLVASHANGAAFDAALSPRSFHVWAVSPVTKTWRRVIDGQLLSVSPNQSLITATRKEGSDYVITGVRALDFAPEFSFRVPDVQLTAQTHTTLSPCGNQFVVDVVHASGERALVVYDRPTQKTSYIPLPRNSNVLNLFAMPQGHVMASVSWPDQAKSDTLLLSYR